MGLAGEFLRVDRRGDFVGDMSAICNGVNAVRHQGRRYRDIVNDQWMEGVRRVIASSSTGRTMHTIGTMIIRYGLVVVIAWIGLLKFTASEAGRIQQYVAHSPFLSWTHLMLGHRALAAIFGCIEVCAALLILLRRWFPRVSAVGSVLAIGLFLTTLSFFFTTPGVGDAAAGGFPALSPTGQFLLKDLVLLGASVWTLGDSLLALRSPVDDRGGLTESEAARSGSASGLG